MLSNGVKRGKFARPTILHIGPMTPKECKIPTLSTRGRDETNIGLLRRGFDTSGILANSYSISIQWRKIMRIMAKIFEMLHSGHKEFSTTACSSRVIWVKGLTFTCRFQQEEAVLLLPRQT
jgi:hypothetical protein